MFFYLNVLWSGCGVDEGPIEGSDSISADHPPNVLVVLVDDLGTDKVAAYGDSPTPPRTPTIDGLAADGVLFRNAWAYASCSPTRAALLTGRYGRRTGVGEVVEPATSGKYELPLSELTIPEMLAFAPDPWSTSLIGKWHLATWVSPNAELGPGLQGFEWYAATFGNLNNSSYPDAYTVEGYYNWQKDLNGALGWETRYTTTDQVDDAIARIATMPEPWFLYLPFNAPHTPSNAPPAELAEIAPGQLETQGGVYTAMLEAMDRELGRLLAAVDLGDTVVMVTGDNGTPEFAVQPPFDPDHAKLTLFEGGIHVPLIVAGPGVAAGAESRALVHAVDVFATVADLAGVDPAGLDQPIDGESLAPLLADPTAAGRPFGYTEHFSPLGTAGPYTEDLRAVRDDRYKLIVDRVAGHDQLFDLQEDPFELDNLIDGGTGYDPDAVAAYDALQAELVRLEGAFATTPGQAER